MNSRWARIGLMIVIVGSVGVFELAPTERAAVALPQEPPKLAKVFRIGGVEEATLLESQVNGWLSASVGVYPERLAITASPLNVLQAVVFYRQYGTTPTVARAAIFLDHFFGDNSGGPELEAELNTRLAGMRRVIDVRSAQGQGSWSEVVGILYEP